MGDLRKWAAKRMAKGDHTLQQPSLKHNGTHQASDSLEGSPEIEAELQECHDLGILDKVVACSTPQNVDTCLTQRHRDAETQDEAIENSRRTFIALYSLSAPLVLCVSALKTIPLVHEWNKTRPCRRLQDRGTRIDPFRESNFGR